jgi:hypothetical protein
LGTDQARDDLTRMNYEEWNAALGRCFFNPGNVGKRVYLHTTRELVREIAGVSNGVEDFVAAVKTGPSSVTRGEMCAKAYALYREWRLRSLEYPPYLGYLCLFSLAAAHEGAWARHAYYPRLWDVLGENNQGAPPQFRDVTPTLWYDLEIWTHNDKKGEWGLFKSQSSIDWIYVGLPIAQTILTEEERRALPELFEEADLEPGAVLPEGQLAARLAPVADTRLRRRTAQLLHATDASDYRSSLLEIIQADLDEWDGKVHRPDGPDQETSARAGLRIWLKEIDPAGFVESRLVASLPASLSSDELLLQNAGFQHKSFECQPQTARLTDALRENDSLEELRAENLRWEGRSEFRCVHTGARLVLQASSLRIFASGGSEMTGFIETNRVPSHGAFFVAAHGFTANEINDWGSKNCRIWSEVRVARGLPARWRLFSAADTLGDGGFATRYPSLSRPSSPRIKFEGGVRGGNGASYFPFALPHIVFDWHSKPTFLNLNGKPLAATDGFRFAVGINDVQDVNKIEAVIGDIKVQTSLFVVRDGWQWGEGRDCPAVNHFGSAGVASDTVRIRGGLVDAPAAPAFVPDTEAIVEETDCAVLLGRVPGQVANIRRGEPLPSWSPVWAVSKTRRIVVFAYCGSSIDDSMPTKGAQDGNTRVWASIIWVNRKRTQEVKHPRVRKLLTKYREVAREL